jgi:ABC-type hemin transport system substrate-binding protein
MTTRTALLFALLATAATGWLLTPGTAAEAPALPRAAHFHKSATTKPSTAVAQRIVSLAPVITETLFALGAGERVVGVTRYCDRPAAARELPKVGGFIDPQLEAILALEPDLVLAMPSKGVRTTLDRSSWASATRSTRSAT